MAKRTKHSPQPITMDDVATACGISKSTVSRALRHPDKVNATTRAAIEKAMAELGYVYNPLASSLTTNRREVLGIMYSLRLLYSVYTDTIALIFNMAQAANYELMFSLTNGQAEQERIALQRMQQYKVSSYIWLEASTETEPMMLERQRQGFPCLMLWQTPLSPELNFVGVDIHTAMATAVGELAGFGHSRIALLLGHGLGQTIAQARHMGFQKALENYGLNYDPALICLLGVLNPTSWKPLIPTARVAVSQMLRMSNPPTAIIVPNSSLAVGVLGALKDAGLRVPEDFSIICLHDDELARYMDPPLTTLDNSREQEHILLTMFLQKVFMGEPVGSYRHMLPVSVHRRGSCGPCPPFRSP